MFFPYYFLLFYVLLCLTSIANYLEDLLNRDNLIEDEEKKRKKLVKILDKLKRNSTLLELEKRYRKTPTKHYTWTHTTIPEEEDREHLRRNIQNRDLRTFLKLSNIKPNLSCYDTLVSGL